MAHQLRDRRILVVEDDGATADLLRDVLADSDARVVVVRDGPDALREWSQQKPHAVILDLRLPGPLDGVDVYQEIRRRAGKPPPTVILSGADEATGSAKALGVPLVRKPFRLEQLLHALETVLPAA